MSDNDPAKRDQLYRMIRAAIHDDYGQCSNLAVLIEMRYPVADADAESRLMHRTIKDYLELRAQLGFEAMEAVYRHELQR